VTHSEAEISPAISRSGTMIMDMPLLKRPAALLPAQGGQ